MTFTDAKTNGKMQIMTVNMPKTLIRLFDQLVCEGFIASRSEGLRVAANAWLKDLKTLDHFEEVPEDYSCEVGAPLPSFLGVTLK